MKDGGSSRFFVGLWTVALSCMLFSGCATLRGDNADSGGSDYGSATVDEGASGPMYYDFGDVLIPVELKKERNYSFVYHAPGYTAGVLGFSGRVDVASLIRFFENNMAKDNWKLVSSFKSPRSMLLFTKTNRICIINITEGRFKAEVEVWVAPVEGEETTLTQ